MHQDFVYENKLLKNLPGYQDTDILLISEGSNRHDKRYKLANLVCGHFRCKVWIFVQRQKEIHNIAWRSLMNVQGKGQKLTNFQLIILFVLFKESNSWNLSFIYEKKCGYIKSTKSGSWTLFGLFSCLGSNYKNILRYITKWPYRLFLQLLSFKFNTIPLTKLT